MSARRWREDALPFALLLPSVAYLALLILLPMIQALLLAVQGDDGALTTEHLQRMAGDVAFRDAIRNTLVLLVLIVPVQIVIALVMALLVHSRLRGHRWFLYVYAIPLAISDLAAGILWLSVFTERGYLNTILQGVGLIKEPITYLSYESLGTVFALAGRNLPIVAGEAYNWYSLNRDPHVAAAYAIVLLSLAIAMTAIYLRVLGTGEAQRVR